MQCAVRCVLWCCAQLCALVRNSMLVRRRQEEGGAAGHKTGQLLVRSSQLVERDRSKVLSEFSVNSQFFYT